MKYRLKNNELSALKFPTRTRIIRPVLISTTKVRACPVLRAVLRDLDDNRLEVENNLCENAIRPLVMARKAWLFSTSVVGVTASAN